MRQRRAGPTLYRATSPPIVWLCVIMSWSVVWNPFVFRWIFFSSFNHFFSFSLLLLHNFFLIFVFCFCKQGPKGCVRGTSFAQGATGFVRGITGLCTDDNTLNLFFFIRDNKGLYMGPQSFLEDHTGSLLLLFLVGNHSVLHRVPHSSHPPPLFFLTWHHTVLCTRDHTGFITGDYIVFFTRYHTVLCTRDHMGFTTGDYIVFFTRDHTVLCPQSGAVNSLQCFSVDLISVDRISYSFARYRTSLLSNRTEKGSFWENEPKEKCFLGGLGGHKWIDATASSVALTARRRGKVLMSTAERELTW